MFDDVGGREPVFNEFFCRGRHCNCNMIYLKQNKFSSDRQNVRENFNLFIFFEERGRATTDIYLDFFNRAVLRYDDYVKRYWTSLIVTSSLINSKTEILMENYELIGIGEFYSLIIFMTKSKSKSKSKSITMTKSKSKCKSMSKYKSMSKSMTMTKTMTLTRSKSKSMTKFNSKSNVK